MTADAKTSSFPRASSLVGDEDVPILQSGADKLTSTGDIADLLGVSAHIAETDPYVHTATHIAYDGTVAAADVQGALDALDAGKVSSTSLNTRLAAVSMSGTTVNKNNSSAEETLFSFTLPGNTLQSAGEILVVEASGDILANSGTPTFTWKFKSGTPTVDTPADPLSVSANLRAFKLRAVIRRTTNVNSQVIGVILTIGAAGTQKAQLADKSYVGNLTDIAATDFAAGTTIGFTVQMSVANANNRVRMYGYTATKVPA